MRGRGELPDGWEETIKAEADQEVRQAIADANRVPAKPPIATLFEDVYADVPWHLREQQAELEAELRKHGEKKSPHAK
jgi:TPP-dependent pyruvate/acetoin dehydrogenase alpha subunit